MFSFIFFSIWSQTKITRGFMSPSVPEELLSWLILLQKNSLCNSFSRQQLASQQSTISPNAAEAVDPHSAAVCLNHLISCQWFYTCSCVFKLQPNSNIPIIICYKKVYINLYKYHDDWVMPRKYTSCGIMLIKHDQHNSSTFSPNIVSLTWNHYCFFPSRRSSRNGHFLAMQMSVKSLSC